MYVLCAWVQVDGAALCFEADTLPCSSLVYPRNTHYAMPSPTGACNRLRGAAGCMMMMVFVFSTREVDARHHHCRVATSCCVMLPPRLVPCVEYCLATSHGGGDGAFHQACACGLLKSWR